MNRTVLCLLLLLASSSATSAAELVIEDAWVREPPPGANAAGYMTLRNPGQEPLRIVGARSPACTRTELHRTVVDDGVARMTPVDTLEVPAGGEVVLAPRGLHLMLIEPKPLRAGDRLELILELEGGETSAVEAEVRKQAPGAEHHGHH